MLIRAIDISLHTRRWKELELVVRMHIEICHINKCFMMKICSHTPRNSYGTRSCNKETTVSILHLYVAFILYQYAQYWHWYNYSISIVMHTKMRCGKRTMHFVLRTLWCHISRKAWELCSSLDGRDVLRILSLRHTAHWRHKSDNLRQPHEKIALVARRPFLKL